jgi:carboxyl-terminal processing protease
MRARLADFQNRRPYHQYQPDPKQLAWTAQRYACFKTVWETVNENYFDPDFGHIDWQAVREKYRAQLVGASDNPKLRVLLQAMLAELHRSHFAIIPREAAVYNPAERERMGGAGAELEAVDGAIVIRSTHPHSPAERAGLRAGDAIGRIDGMALADLARSLATSGLSPSRCSMYLRDFAESRLSQAVGTNVRLTASDVTGAARELVVKCGPAEGVWSEPVGYFPSLPIRCEARRDASGIAYLRFNAFALPVMSEYKKLIHSLQPGDGLIIDLRGNAGGLGIIASGMCGWLSDKGFSLGTMHLRDSQQDLDVYPQRRAFLGPVAVLVNSTSASTSEILAAGLQESHRARLFGETSAGAVLLSLPSPI